MALQESSTFRFLCLPKRSVQNAKDCSARGLHAGKTVRDSKTVLFTRFESTVFQRAVFCRLGWHVKGALVGHPGVAKHDIGDLRVIQHRPIQLRAIIVLLQVMVDPGIFLLYLEVIPGNSWTTTKTTN